jgi:hypothetical protein
MIPIKYPISFLNKQYFSFKLIALKRDRISLVLVVK